MQIFWNELRKILNWRMLVILLVFTGLYYNLAMKNSLAYSAADLAEIQTGQAMLQKYGTSMDSAEQDDFENTIFKDMKQKVNQQIAGMKAFQDAHIKNVDELEALAKKGGSESAALYNSLGKTVSETENNPSPYDVYENARSMIGNFKSKTIHAATEPQAYKGSDAASVKEREQAGRTSFSVLPSCVEGSLKTLVYSLFVLLVFSVVILITPYLVRERRSGVRTLAYTSKKGRALFRTQFAAALAAAVLVAAVQFAVLLFLLCTGQHRVDFVFRDCLISNTIFDQGFLWWDLTLGQSMLLNCLLVFAFVIGFAVFSFVISKLCRNYVAAVAVQIPAVLLCFKIGDVVFTDLFWVVKSGMMNLSLFNLFGLNYEQLQRMASGFQYAEAELCAACLLVPLLVCLFLNHREKKTDIL